MPRFLNYLILSIGFLGLNLGLRYQYNPLLLTFKDFNRQVLQTSYDSLISDRIVFYNTENLFHPSDDTIKTDEDFTPAGSYHWTWNRYYDKINKLGKLFVAIGEGRMPAIIGLCEIENRFVDFYPNVENIQDLVEKHLMSNSLYNVSKSY